MKRSQKLNENYQICEKIELNDFFLFIKLNYSKEKIKKKSTYISLMSKVRKARVPPYLSRSHVAERVVAMNLLKGFKAQGSRGEKLIFEITGIPLECISKTALSKLAYTLSVLTEIKISRNLRRRKDLLVKWFEENEDKIKIFKSHVSIELEKE